MQSAFSPDGAVKSKLVKKVNVRRPEFLTAKIPVGHQIFGSFYFMDSRTNRQKRRVKTSAVESDEFVVFFRPFPEIFQHLFFRTGFESYVFFLKFLKIFARRLEVNHALIFVVI